MENGYYFDGEKSDIRLNNGANLSFVFSTGTSASNSSSSSAQRDSMMKANGMDPSMTSGMAGMNDLSHTVALYILLQKAGGAFGSKKNQSSDKYLFSV